jgi:hypothetical protein
MMRIRWAEHVKCKEEKRGVENVVVKSQRRGSLKGTGRRCEDNIKKDLTGTRCEGVSWFV